MRGLLLISTVLFILAILAAKTEQSQAQVAPRIVAYYSSWSIYARGYRVTDIPADQITHLNYAFFNISEQGECVLGDPWADTEYAYPGDEEGQALRGNFHQLNLLKQAHPHLKTLMAIGGWTWSGRFSDVALTNESRARFAQSCIALMTRYNFDGLDIDWEYPVGGGLETNITRPEDKANYTLLLAELRAQLDTQTALDGRPYLLTIAAPAGPQTYAHYELDRIHPYLDWINIMAYDFAGGWSTTTGHQANLYPSGAARLSGDQAVRDYLAAGIPPDKIVLGVPFYGRAWRGVGPDDEGLHQPYGATYGEGGYVTYREIALILPALVHHWDEAGQATWAYSPAAEIMVSYDDAEALAAKAAYIREMTLGGVMIWELAGDDRQNTLLNALYTAMIGQTTEE